MARRSQKYNKKKKGKPQYSNPTQLPDLSFLKTTEANLPQSTTADNPRSESQAQSITTPLVPTPSSLICPESTNRAGLSQLEALRQAKSWFTGAGRLLRDRLELAEEMQHGLSSLLELLEIIEREGIDKQFGEGHTLNMPKIREAENQEAASNEIKNVIRLQDAEKQAVVESDRRSDTKEEPLNKQRPLDVPSHDPNTGSDECDSESDASSVNIITELPQITLSVWANVRTGLDVEEQSGRSLDIYDPIPYHHDTHDESSLTTARTVTTNLEEAAGRWIKRVRVLRAKWNAGGRGMGWMGLS